jgi:predicted Zn-dependent protease
MRIMRNYFAFVLAGMLLLLSCSTVAVTGRKQLNLVPRSTMLSMSYQQYGEFLKTHKLSDNQQQTQMVKRVGNRIQRAVSRYFTEQGMADKLKDYEWEFNLVESEEVNAWCMPGGKVVFYTGILPVTQDENGLAVVMGHEIAHAIAQHGNERMSQMLMGQLGGMALSKALEKEPEKTQELWMTAFGIGAQLGVFLPFSRLHESEADRLGLIFMSMAGYDPKGAVEFWQRMVKMGGGQAPPEFLSTHPSYEKRIENLQALVPEAMQYYREPGTE